MKKKLHYKDFNEFIELYGNLPWDDYMYFFREFIDGYKLLSKDKKMNFIKGIDFYGIKI